MSLSLLFTPGEYAAHKGIALAAAKRELAGLVASCAVLESFGVVRTAEGNTARRKLFTFAENDPGTLQAIENAKAAWPFN